MSVAVTNRINDLNSVLRTTEDHSVVQLQEIAQELDTWKTKVLTLQYGVYVMCCGECDSTSLA